VIGGVLVALLVAIPVAFVLANVPSDTPRAPRLDIATPAPLVADGGPTPPGRADPVLAAQTAALAQQLLDALAARRYDEARTLLATGRYSDSDVDKAYPFLVSGTVAVLQTWALDRARVDLRAVLVVEEDPLGGRRTRAVCARWIVDDAARKIRVRTEKELASERGTHDPAAMAQDVAAACVDLALP
jgi:hypothetical protein